LIDDLQDVQATIDDRSGGAQRKRRTEDIEPKSPSATDVSSGDGPRKTELSVMSPGPPKFKQPPQLSASATSTCMIKTDLGEFVKAQGNAVAGVVALNPAVKAETSREAYKWPTRSLGCQIGPSLTDLTKQGGDVSDGRRQSCSAAFRLGTK